MNSAFLQIGDRILNRGLIACIDLSYPRPTNAGGGTCVRVWLIPTAATNPLLAAAGMTDPLHSTTLPPFFESANAEESNRWRKYFERAAAAGLITIIDGAGITLPLTRETVEISGQQPPRNKGGRPKGYSPKKAKLASKTANKQLGKAATA